MDIKFHDITLSFKHSQEKIDVSEILYLCNATLDAPTAKSNFEVMISKLVIINFVSSLEQTHQSLKGTAVFTDITDQLRISVEMKRAGLVEIVFAIKYEYTASIELKIVTSIDQSYIPMIANQFLEFANQLD